jgi:hypothetical protein
MNLRKLLTMAFVLSFVVFAQNPITADSPFQVRYAANLNLGESWVNIVNTGAQGAQLAAIPQAILGRPDLWPAQVVGTICANVYIFTPDEQMLSCCTCPVTPNQVVHLGANRDLISNPLTPVTNVTSVTIKVLGTAPVGGTCNAAAPGALATGLAAWGTTLHTGAPGVTAPQITETAFTPATLSGPGTGANIGELARLSQLCTFIQANGSGFGICRACRLGAMGAARR